MKRFPHTGLSFEICFIWGCFIKGTPPTIAFLLRFFEGVHSTVPHGTYVALSYFVVRVGDIVSVKELL